MFNRYSVSALVVGLIGSGWCFYSAWLTPPSVRQFDAPAHTSWRPSGPRTPSYANNDVVPQPVAWATMHGDLQQSDEMWTAAAPVFELDWVAEPEMFIPEGPTFDNEGRLFFSPLNPKEDVSLVALDAETGERLWTLPGGGNGGGAPLILNNPDDLPRKVVYHATYDDFWAVRPDGDVIWHHKTSLPEAEDDGSGYQPTHQWGVAYVPQADAVIGVTMNAFLFAHDRRSGRPLAPPYRLPGRPTKGTDLSNKFPDFIMKAARSESERAFGAAHFDRVLETIFGGGAQISNAYAVDPHSGRIYIAATAPDASDGELDGYSENGAIYAVELVPGESGFQFQVAQSYVFRGGSGSTPALSQDGARLMVSDELGHVIALDAMTLTEDWRLNVGDQLVASVAVSSDNHELYAVTKTDVIKLVDKGDSGEIAWIADLDAYPNASNFNALTPTIVANGLLISQASGIQIGDGHLMSNVGIGLLDREAGKLRYYAEGREDSISVTSVGPGGDVYTAGSPIRRMAAKALFGDRIPEIVGGISRYRNTSPQLLEKEALCAAVHRATNALKFEESHPRSFATDTAHVGVLLKQASQSNTQAESLLASDWVLQDVIDAFHAQCQ